MACGVPESSRVSGTPGNNSGQPPPVMTARLCSCCLLVASVLCVLPFAAASDRQTAINGAYDDAGTIVVAPPGEPPPVVSLHALLTLQFIPGIVQMLHDQTGEVRLTHTAGQLRLVITNREGDAILERVWREGDDYGLRDGRVLLHFRGARQGDADHVLLLETVTAYKLLQVEVQRHTSTLLGPRIQSLGTYLFHRAE